MIAVTPQETEMIKRNFMRGTGWAALAAALLLWAVRSGAETYPSKPLRMVVPFAAVAAPISLPGP